MNNNNLGFLLGAFIIILVATVLIDSIADTVSELDDTVTLANNESITWPGNDTAFDLANDDIVTNSEIVYNQSHKLTRGTHYTMGSGTITFTNDSAEGEDPAYDFTAGSPTLNITYTHEGDLYLDDTSSRTLIDLVIIFFALGILAVGYLIVKRGYDDMGF